MLFEVIGDTLDKLSRGHGQSQKKKKSYSQNDFWGHEGFNSHPMSVESWFSVIKNIVLHLLLISTYCFFRVLGSIACIVSERKNVHHR